MKYLALFLVTFAGTFSAPAQTPAPQTSTPSPAAAAPVSNSSETARILVGFAQTGSPQALPVQHAFVDFYFSRPLPPPRLSLWGNVQLASLPRPVSSTILSFSTDLVNTIFKTPLYQLAQSGEFAAGLEYEVASAPGKARVGATASYGASLPLGWSPVVNRFPRQYWVGMRFSSTSGVEHVLDVAAGQNEAITGGVLHGPVIRFHGEYGLPVAKKGVVYLIGEAQLAGSKTGHPADLYRLGLGLDFIQMLKALGSN